MKAEVDLVNGNKAYYYVAYTNDTEILAFIGLFVHARVVTTESF